MTQPPTPPADGTPDPNQQYPQQPPPPPPAEAPGAPAAGAAGQQVPPGGQYPQQSAGGQFPPPVPPPPPGGQPAATGTGFDPSAVAKGDWTVFGIGLLMVIFGFFGWYSVSSSIGMSASIGGWNGWWVIIQLILLATLAVRAVQVFTGNLRKELPPITLPAAGALLFVLYLIALIDAFSKGGSASVLGASYSAGPGFGIWACLILSIGLAYFLALSAQKQGKLPFAVPGPAGF